MGVPVATPVSLRDVGAGVASLFKPGGKVPAFGEDIMSLYGHRPYALVNSGRAALYLVLAAMKGTSLRDEVVIPAFVCPTVGRAVAKAGLRTVLCDVNARDFGPDLDALQQAIGRRTLAVITTHLFGYPTDVAPILGLARSAGAMVIEDCAQAFGAAVDGRQTGTSADAGVFSFGMSKVLFTMGGGLLLANNPLVAERLSGMLPSIPPASRASQAAGLLKFSAVSVLVQGHHLGPFAGVWAGALRGRHDTDDFTAEAYSPAQAAVGSSLLKRIGEITAIRQRHAAYFAERLSDFRGIRLPQSQPGSRPVFLRFPIVVQDPVRRNILLTRLKRKGINASEMYDRSSYARLREFAPGDRNLPGTEYLVDRILNLPTHPYVRREDLEDTVTAFEETFSNG
jgi:perosamine synthetase